MNRIRTVFSLLFFLSIPTAVFSGQKIHGKIGYGYTQSNSKDIRNNNGQSTYTQEYMIGYRGNIYSPRLFAYTMEVSLLDNTSTSTNNDTSTRNDSKNTNYNFNASILGATNIPITLYATKTSNPYTSVTSNSSSSYMVTSDSYGVNGAVKHPLIDVSYFFTSANLKNRSITTSEEKLNNDYGMSLRKSFGVSSLLFSVSDHMRDYTVEGTAPRSWSDTSRVVELSGSTKVTKAVQVSTALGYQTLSPNTKIYTGNVGISWSPTKSYSASLNLNTNKTDSATGSYETTNIAGSSTYQVNEKLSTNQSLMLMKMKTGAMENTVMMATLGANYATRYDNGIVWSTNGNLMGSSNKTNGAISSNQTLTTILVGSSLSKMFLLSDTANISLNGGISGSSNSRNDMTQQYFFTSGLTKTLGKNMSYSMTAYTRRDIRKSRDYPNSETSVYGIDNRLNHSMKVGMDGLLTTSIGALYTVSQISEGTDSNNFSPLISIGYNQRLASRLMLTSNVSASQDSYSESTNYNSSIGINYALRSIYINAGGNYSVNKGVNGERSRDSLFINASRPF